MKELNLGGTVFGRDWLDRSNITGSTNQEQTKEIAGTTYDAAQLPHINIDQAIETGLIQLKAGDILKGWDFSMPENQEITIPDGVILESCTISSGRVIFPSGDCSVIGSNGVAIASGSEASAIALVAGAYVFAAAADAKVILMVPGSFGFGTAANSIVEKHADGAHATTFLQLQQAEQAAKDKADTEGDDNAACRFGLLSLSKHFQSSYSKEEAFRYLMAASENGNANASLFLGKICITGEYDAVPHFELAEAFLEQAVEQGHNDARYELGQLYSISPHQIKEIDDRYMIYSGIAYIHYGDAAYEDGHPLAQEKVAEHEANNGQAMDMFHLVSTLNALGLY